MKRIIISAVLLMLFLPSCRGENVKRIYYEGLSLKGIEIAFIILGEIEDGVLVVRDTVDLKGHTCSLPPRILLDVTKGQIRNGELVGHNNKLKCKDGAFHRVRIKGEWIVPIIKSSFFSDLSYDNAICDIVALSNEQVRNKIYIDEGDYQVTIKSPWHGGINLNSNTELNLNGTIRLTPNDHPGCYIINVKGENVKIRGEGRIIGDKEAHIGKTGAWGMGINIDESKNILISGIAVSSCWGDCIYVGGAERIRIQDCTLDDSRRQGVSITAAQDVTIKRCRISGIGGIAPGYAIDVEPNEADSCKNIRITRVDICDCNGGILVWGAAQDASVHSIKMKNCELDSVKKEAFCLGYVDDVIVKQCKVQNYGNRKPISLNHVNNFKEKNVIVEQ